MKKATFIVVALVMLVISACNFPFVGESENALATTVAQTVEAMEAEEKQPTLAVVTQAPTLSVPTATPVPTEEPEDTEEPDPCLFATFVSETIPDNTKYSPGAAFTKSWTLRNTGTCDWNVDYKISFKSGDQMGGPDEQNIPQETDPGEDVELAINLTAPASAGTYTGYWQMETHQGVAFGEVWVKIVVE